MILWNKFGLIWSCILKVMNFLIFRNFFQNLKSIYLIKIDFINRASDVAKSRASDIKAIEDLGKG